MALKQIKSNGKDVAKKKSSDIKSVYVKGKHIQQFNAAKAALARAEAEIAEIEPILKREGSREVFASRLRSGQDGDTKSVKLIDESGEGVRVTLSSVYPVLSEESAVALFEEALLKADGSKGDVNDYVFQTRKAKFDSKAFIKDGEFNDRAYLAFFKACADAAKALGIDNPLSTEVVVAVKPDFDQKRYSDFDLTAQVRIYETVPNKTSITPIVGE
jgi:hypothetical protein